MPIGYGLGEQVPFYNARNHCPQLSFYDSNLLRLNLDIQLEHLPVDRENRAVLYRSVNFMLLLGGLSTINDMTTDRSYDIVTFGYMNFSLSNIIMHNVTCEAFDNNMYFIAKHYFPQMEDNMRHGNVSRKYMISNSEMMIANPCLMRRYHMLVSSVGEFLGGGFRSVVHEQISADRRRHLLVSDKIGVTLILLESVLGSVMCVFNVVALPNKIVVHRAIDTMQSAINIADDYVATIRELINEEEAFRNHGQGSPEYLKSLHEFVAELEGAIDGLIGMRQAIISEHKIDKSMGSSALLPSTTLATADAVTQRWGTVDRGIMWPD